MHLPCEALDLPDDQMQLGKLLGASSNSRPEQSRVGIFYSEAPETTVNSP